MVYRIKIAKYPNCVLQTTNINEYQQLQNFCFSTYQTDFCLWGEVKFVSEFITIFEIHSFVLESCWSIESLNSDVN